jgi:cytochrome P450
MTTTLSRRADVEAALDHPDLVPFCTNAGLGWGSTAMLVRSMARFSDGRAHAERRAAVEAVVAHLMAQPLRELAAARTTVRSVEHGRHVPTETLADALGIDSDGLETDVDAIAAVIGRGEPPTAASEAAADRLLRRCSVPVISILYQAHDATANLVAATVEARNTATTRQPAVRETRRRATRDTDVQGTALRRDEVVVLDLAAAGLEYGAGPHVCPGRAVAEAIVQGVMDVLPC